MVICLELGADLHTAQLMPLPLTVPCFSKIQIGVTHLVPAHPGIPGQRAVKRVCVCVVYDRSTADSAVAAARKAGASSVDSRRSKEALQFGTSSIGSLSGKVPPQRPPPPSPAALSKVRQLSSGFEQKGKD